MTAYYNEYDPAAAAWLRNLIAAGHIAPGVVDTRSILDVRPTDLRGFTQHHFFAGIGVWSYALRAAGWRDDRPVWTGSCPCQPFSSAGDGAGFADERHLWPAFFHLIAEHAKWCRSQKLPVPEVVGEQVASKDVNTWIDLVQADMEGLGYAFGAIAFPSAGVGAPHIRDRTYWMAAPNYTRLEGRRGHKRAASGAKRGRDVDSGSSRLGRLADADGRKLDGVAIIRGNVSNGVDRGREKISRQPESCGDIYRMADALCAGPLSSAYAGIHCGEKSTGARNGELERLGSASPERAGPTNGFWRDADWLGCRDGKWRPVEPGTFPLVAGAAGRVGRMRADWHAPAGKEGQGHRAGRLKGYGNAINAHAAIEFIQSVMEVQESVF